MIPLIEDLKLRFNLDDFIVVADSGFMISRNIELLRSGGYKFIVGGRIKKQKGDILEWIKTLAHVDNVFYEHKLDNGDRLIVTYSSKRAAKGAYNRNKDIERLRKAYATGRITKDKISKRGYSKFLKIENDVKEA